MRAGRGRRRGGKVAEEGRREGSRLPLRPSVRVEDEPAAGLAAVGEVQRCLERALDPAPDELVGILGGLGDRELRRGLAEPVKASSRIAIMRPVRLCVLAIVKSHASCRSARCTPTCSSAAKFCSIAGRRASNDASVVRWPSRYAANAGVGAMEWPDASTRPRMPTTIRCPSAKLTAGWIMSSGVWPGSALASSSAQNGCRSPVVASSTTIGELPSSERFASTSPGSFDFVASRPGICAIITEPGLHPSARFWSVTSMWTPLLAGIDAVARASRRLVGVDGSAMVKWSFGNGSMQLAPMGSQRCSVVGVTPMVEISTAGAAAFGGGTDVVVTARVLRRPELLHADAATSTAEQSAPTMSRDFVDIVSPGRRRRTRRTYQRVLFLGGRKIPMKHVLIRCLLSHPSGMVRTDVRLLLPPVPSSKRSHSSSTRRRSRGTRRCAWSTSWARSGVWSTACWPRPRSGSPIRARTRRRAIAMLRPRSLVPSVSAPAKSALRWKPRRSSDNSGDGCRGAEGHALPRSKAWMIADAATINPSRPSRSCWTRPNTGSFP